MNIWFLFSSTNNVSVSVTTKISKDDPDKSKVSIIVKSLSIKAGIVKLKFAAPAELVTLPSKNSSVWAAWIAPCRVLTL